MYRLARSVRILCFAESTWYYTRSWVWCVLGNACYVWVVYCKGIVDLPDQCPSLGTSATNEALSDPPATTWAAYQVSNIATIITMAAITIIADSNADFVRVCKKNRKWTAFPNLKCPSEYLDVTHSINHYYQQIIGAKLQQKKKI